VYSLPEAVALFPLPLPWRALKQWVVVVRLGGGVVGWCNTGLGGSPSPQPDTFITLTPRLIAFVFAFKC